MDDQLDEKTLAIKQALKFAEDLVVVYQDEKNRTKELEVANEKIRATIDSMSDGMLAIDRNNSIIDLNPIICRYLERDRTELLGQQLEAVIPSPELIAKIKELDRTDNLTGRLEIENMFSVRRFMRISISKIRKQQGYVFVFHDVTNEKRIENLKTEFFAILSHELRTPLTAMIGFTDILSDELNEKLEPEHREFLADIKSAETRMLQTVEGLLNFANLLGKDFGSQKELVDIASLLQEILQEVGARYPEKGTEIRAFQTNTKYEVLGYKTMLRELFKQVTVNAILFGKQAGYLAVDVSVNETDYEISIKDNGIGIPAPELERVFDSFYQVEGYLTRSQDGLGLGLSLAKRIVELHDGEIRLESILDQGTTCFINLPKYAISSQT